MSKTIKVDVIKDRDYKRHGQVTPGRVAKNHHAEITPGVSIVLFGTTTDHKYDADTRKVVEVVREYRREFKVGDLAEFDSYNLDYHGKIIDIKPNTIIVEGHGRNKHMNVFEFDFRNYDLNLEASRQRNAQASQEI